ncbi:MAG: universal stress protein [Eubacteriales bacterium]
MGGKVLLAYDGSESSVRAAEFAAKFMKMFPGTSITALTVSLCAWEMANIVQTSDMIQNISDARTEEAMEINSTVQPIFDRENVPVKRSVKQGFADVIINRYARIGGHEQIIMGTRGLGGVLGILLGSISRKVISQANCPVTLVK